MKHYYMFNKPFGCVTAHRDDRFPVVMDYFRSLENDRLSPVGRLDRETEGLLMITDDGIWNQKMTNPAFHVPKTYEFAALGTLNEENLQRLSEGVLLIGSDRPTTGASVTVTGTSLLSKVVPHLHPDMQEKLKYNLPDHPVVIWHHHHLRRPQTPDPPHAESRWLLCNSSETHFYGFYCAG